MKRHEIYERIDQERSYQDKVWGIGGERRAGESVTPGEGPNHSVGNFIVFMEHYLNLAKQELSTKRGHHEALHQLRKVAALAVACFEQHCCPQRNTP